jgi:hypothetical protein
MTDKQTEEMKTEKMSDFELQSVCISNHNESNLASNSK